MKFATFLSSIICASIIGLAANASTVTVTFGGSVNWMGSFQNTPYQVGQRLTGSFSYDDQQNSQSVNGSIYWWDTFDVQNADLGLSYSFPLAGNRQLSVATGNPNGFFVTGRSVSQSSQDEVSAIVRVNSTTSQPLGSSVLSRLEPAISGPISNYWENKSIQLTFRGVGDWGICTGACTVNAVIDTLSVTNDIVPVSPVPIPAALPLLGLGIAGLGFIGRRRKGQ